MSSNFQAIRIFRSWNKNFCLPSDLHKDPTQPEENSFELASSNGDWSICDRTWRKMNFIFLLHWPTLKNLSFFSAQSLQDQIDRHSFATTKKTKFFHLDSLFECDDGVCIYLDNKIPTLPLFLPVFQHQTENRVLSRYLKIKLCHFASVFSRLAALGSGFIIKRTKKGMKMLP